MDDCLKRERNGEANMWIFCLRHNIYSRNVGIIIATILVKRYMSAGMFAESFQMNLMGGEQKQKKKKEREHNLFLSCSQFT